MNSKSKWILPVLGCWLLSGCFGNNCATGSASCGNSGGSSSGGGSSGSDSLDDFPTTYEEVLTYENLTETAPAGGFMDCSNLDPDKIYIQGRVTVNERTIYGLAEISDPSFFCTGSISRWPSIAADGRLLHENVIYDVEVTETSVSTINLGAAVSRFTQDAWTETSDGTIQPTIPWGYPLTYENDEFLVFLNEEATVVTEIVADPNDPGLFFYGYFNKYFNTQSALIYDYGDAVGDVVVIGMTYDSRLVLGVTGSGDDHLLLIYQTGEQTRIEKPDGMGSFRHYHQGKRHPGGMYFLAGDGEIWNMANDFTFTKLGDAAPRPAGFVTDAFAKLRFDIDGNLYEYHATSGGDQIYKVLKRPLDDGAGSAGSEVLFDPDDPDLAAAEYFVQLRGLSNTGGIVTGP